MNIQHCLVYQVLPDVYIVKVLRMWTHIELAPGRYLCHDADGILVDGLEDVTIDGAGAVLVFYRPATSVPGWMFPDSTEHPTPNFLIKDCRRVRFGRLAVDWDWSIDPLATLCRLRVWPGVLPTAPDAVVGDYARERSFSAKRNFEEVKSLLPFKGRLFRIAHCYYGKNAFEMDSCVDLVLHDIRIYSASGMGFVVKGLQHHWSLENCVIEPPPGEARPITVTADSVHVVSSCGWAKVSGLRVRLNQDDIMNFHDKATVVRRASPRRLAFVHRRANPYFRAKAGTQVELRQANYAPTGLHASVLAATDTELELDRDVPEPAFGSYVLFNDAYATDHVLVRDGHFDDANGRCVFMGNDITVENCTFKNTTRTVFKLQTALLMRHCAEGYGTTNVVVRGCTFENCDRMLSESFAGRGAVESFIGRTMRVHYDDEGAFDIPDWTGVVGDILFEKNTWINPRIPLMHVYCAHNVLVRDNTVVMAAPRTGRNLPHRGEILHERAEGVRAYGNRILRLDR